MRLGIWNLHGWLVVILTMELPRLLGMGKGVRYPTMRPGISESVLRFCPGEPTTYGHFFMPSTISHDF